MNVHDYQLTELAVQHGLDVLVTLPDNAGFIAIEAKYASANTSKSKRAVAPIPTTALPSSVLKDFPRLATDDKRFVQRLVSRLANLAITEESSGQRSDPGLSDPDGEEFDRELSRLESETGEGEGPEDEGSGEGKGPARRT